MGWSFASVNGRLAEIFFDEGESKTKKKKSIAILGHCYVKKEEYTTKKERAWIEKDTKEMRLVYRKGKYTLHKNTGESVRKLNITTQKFRR